MELTEYQAEAHKTAQYPKIKVHPLGGSELAVNADWVYAVFGLVGETGELVEKLKKVIRNQDGIIFDSDLKEVSKELGDILWYLSETATLLGLNLDEIAQQNLDKLQSRAERNVIKSEGDNR